MNETNSSEKNQVWEKLTSEEKAILIAYKNQLMRDKKPAQKMIERVSEIYKQHDEFDMSCVP